MIPKKKSKQQFITGNQEFIRIPREKIKPGKHQPRLNIDSAELQELAESIQQKGFIQPIVVRKSDDDHYEVIAGGRRLEAANYLKIKEIPAIIKEVNDQEALLLAITENLQRKNLNPIEEALAFKQLIDEFELTQQEIGNMLGKNKSYVANTLRLLKLPPNIQQALHQGVLNRSQARTILGFEEEALQQKLFHKIVRNNLVVREIEKEIQRKKRKKESKDIFVLEVEETLQKKLGTKVKIMNKRGNRGVILIEYYSSQDLERIIAKIN